MKDVKIISVFLLMVLILIGCSEGAKSTNKSSIELKIGDIYSAKSNVSITTPDGEKEHPYTLIKIIDIDGDIIYWRTFSNHFSERPRSADSSLNYSGNEIENFGLTTGFISSGKENIKGFKNNLKEKEAEFFIHDSISEYDLEVIDDINEI